MSLDHSHPPGSDQLTEVVVRKQFLASLLVLCVTGSVTAAAEPVKVAVERLRQAFGEDTPAADAKYIVRLSEDTDTIIAFDDWEPLPDGRVRFSPLYLVSGSEDDKTGSGEIRLRGDSAVLTFEKPFQITGDPGDLRSVRLSNGFRLTFPRANQ